MVLEKILESPLYNKEIKPVNLKGNQPVTRTDSAEDSPEGFQVERMDSSIAKEPIRGCSERLKSLSTLGFLFHVFYSPQ